jgi:hypothetical protein
MCGSSCATARQPRTSRGSGVSADGLAPLRADPSRAELSPTSRAAPELRCTWRARRRVLDDKEGLVVAIPKDTAHDVVNNRTDSLSFKVGKRARWAAGPAAAPSPPAAPPAEQRPPPRCSTMACWRTSPRRRSTRHAARRWWRECWLATMAPSCATGRSVPRVACASVGRALGTGQAVARAAAVKAAVSLRSKQQPGSSSAAARPATPLQTGAGKTFTMSGELRSYSHRGLVPRAIQQLFREIERRVDRSHTVKVRRLLPGRLQQAVAGAERQRPALQPATLAAPVMRLADLLTGAATSSPHTARAAGAGGVPLAPLLLLAFSPAPRCPSWRCTTRPCMTCCRPSPPPTTTWPSWRTGTATPT